MESLNKRISKIIEYSGLTSSEFADEIDVQRSSISHITSGRNKPSLDFISKIKDRFPEIQWDWLIKGNGDMLSPTFNSENRNLRDNTLEKENPSLPDLFSLIDDKNFGVTESEDRIEKLSPSELNKTESTSINEIISDSQRLEPKVTENIIQSTENQLDKIKRIVIFLENGTFESYKA